MDGGVEKREIYYIRWKKVAVKQVIIFDNVFF